VGSVKVRRAQKRSVAEAARRSQILRKRSLSIQAGRCARYAQSSSPPLPPYPLPSGAQIWGTCGIPVGHQWRIYVSVIVDVIADSFWMSPTHRRRDGSRRRLLLLGEQLWGTVALTGQGARPSSWPRGESPDGSAAWAADREQAPP
jgi:hypothetical protein